MICIACNKPTSHKDLEVRDHSVSGEIFTVRKCNACGLGQTLTDSGINLDAYYESPNYISHTSKSTNLLQQIYLQARRYTLNQKVSLVNRLIGKTGNILDIGCGTGAFLRHCKKSGYNISGTEPGEKPRAIAEHHLGISLYRSITDIPSKQTFNFISLWHVLEHVQDPLDTLRTVVDRLSAGGKIIIAVPNHLSHDSLHYDKDWAGYDVPRHLWHFSSRSLDKLATQTGLKVTKILPMKLDSYYVSLLSEQYRGTNKLGQWLQGLYHGLQSNLAARKSGEWSSLIYILQP